MNSGFFILQRDLRKERVYRGFVENANAEHLEDFEQTSLTFNLLSNYCHQRVHAHSDPQLSTHRVFRTPVERFNSQMLFDPFEEQFHLPALPIELGHQQRAQAEGVGKKYQASRLLSIVETNPAQFVRIIASGVEPIERDRLITPQTRSLIHWVGVHTAVTH